MKKKVLLFLSLFIIQSIQSQDLAKLSYAELDSLSAIAYEQRDFPACIAYLQICRAKAAKDFGGQDSSSAAYINNLAISYQEMGQYPKALSLYHEARSIKEKILGKTHQDYALSLNNIASLYQKMGNYELAISLYTQSKKIYEKLYGTEHPAFAQVLNNLASLHKDMGKYETALPIYIQAKNILEKTVGLNHPSLAGALNNLALLYQAMGNYKEALPLYNQARGIIENVFGAGHPYVARSLLNLAALHQLMGDYEAALPLCIQAKDIYQATAGTENPEFATVLNNLASAYQGMGNYKAALPLYIQAKDIREKVLGTEHVYFSGSWNSLAEIYRLMDNPEMAWKALQQAIKSSSGLDMSRNISPAWADSLLHATYLSNGHIEKMTETLDYLYKLLKKERIQIQKDSSEIREVIVADLAIALLAKLRNKHSTDGDKLRTLAKSHDWLLISLKILDKKIAAAKAFELADENKSVLLLQATKAEQAYQLGELPDSLVLQDKNLIKERDKLEASLLEHRPPAVHDSLRAALIQTNHDIDVFEETIRKKYPKYAKLKYQHIDAKVKDIQQIVDESTAFIEYLIGDSSVHIFYVTKNEIRWVEKIISNQELSREIKDLHNVLSDYSLLDKKANESYQKYTTAAFWFYKNLLEPVLKANENIKNLIIVPDGELAHLPFETFLVEAASQTPTSYDKLHYLVKDYNISYNYSATLWKENVETPPHKNNGQILGIAANYEIPLDSIMLERRLPTDQWTRETLIPLPAARKEVETLQAEFSGFFAFDKDASEKTIKEKAGDYAIIHLAVHGLLDSKRPVLSCLAFTEDSDSVENNFWQAYEISKMELNADLVVLSACETGYGKFEQGNGVASLARAFMYAGASSLIVSLWQVNDYATSEIMKNLYSNLAAGMNKDQALRQAKLDYIKIAKGIAAHPAFWSPFIQIGNTKPMYLKTKGGWFWWAIGGGVLALGLGAILLRRKK